MRLTTRQRLVTIGAVVVTTAACANVFAPNPATGASAERRTPITHAAPAAPVDAAASISSVPGVVDPGQSSTVSGVVTSNGSFLGGAVVSLMARPMGERGRWVVAQSAHTRADGSVQFTVSPTQWMSYRLRIDSPTLSLREITPAVHVVVRTPSRLTARGIAGGESRTSVVGRLSAPGAPQPGRMVQLETKGIDSSEWSPVARALTSEHGFVRFTRPSSPRSHYRLVYGGDESHLPSRSKIVID